MTRLPVNGPQVRIGVIVPGDEVIHLVGARESADVTDAFVVAEDTLALRVPFLGQAHAAGTALPLTGSHAEPPELQLERISPCLNAGAAMQLVT